MFLLVLFILFNVFFATFGFVAHFFMNKNLAIAKAGGYLITANLSGLLVPVMKNFMTYLRASPIGYYFVKYSNITLHKYFAYGVVVGCVIHAIGQMLIILEGISEDLSLYEVFFDYDYVWGVNRIRNYTGILLTLLLIFLFVGTYFRKKNYKYFIISHYAYVPIILLTLLHMKNLRILFFNFGLFVFEKTMEKMMENKEVQLREAHLINDVLILYFQKPFTYFGMLLFLYIFRRTILVTQIPWRVASFYDIITAGRQTDDSTHSLSEE